MDARDIIQEALRQTIEGMDYEPLDRLIGELTPAQATTRPLGQPYTIATVTWHTWFWVNAWLVAIKGQGDAFGGHDPDSTWPDIAQEQWYQVRDRLQSALYEARQLAANQALDRITWQDQTVAQNLLQIAVHTAYHIGQIALIKQML